MNGPTGTVLGRPAYFRPRRHDAVRGRLHVVRQGERLHKAPTSVKDTRKGLCRRPVRSGHLDSAHQKVSVQKDRQLIRSQMHPLRRLEPDNGVNRSIVIILDDKIVRPVRTSVAWALPHGDDWVINVSARVHIKAVREAGSKALWGCNRELRLALGFQGESRQRQVESARGKGLDHLDRGAGNKVDVPVRVALDARFDHPGTLAGESDFPRRVELLHWRDMARAGRLRP